MVRIRLRKVGSKAQQSFRIVAAESHHPRDGRFIEALGYYNPRTHPSTIEVDEARVYHWLSNGAQPTDSVLQLFKSTGTTARFERLKKGEATQEALLEEAAQALAARRPTASTMAAIASRTKPSKKQQGQKKA